MRAVADPFVVPGPSGVSIRDRLRGLTPHDDEVLRLLGAYAGSLASRDLAARCRDGLGHSNETWAARKRELTAVSSSRWAGSITRATHDQWALARRGQAAHLDSLDTGIRTTRHRLSLPIGEKGTKRAPGGYRSRQEWFAKSRRLATLEDRHAAVAADYVSGRVRVARGGRKLLNTRHHLAAANLTEAQWRERWEAARRFLSADGESGKRYGNETIRVTPDGGISIKLPAALAEHANARHGRYVLAAQVCFPHRGAEWRDRVEADRAIAYRLHYDTRRGRWYLDASWTRPVVRTMPLDAARAAGMVGVDTNADHFATWRLDPHGNPLGDPRRFFYDLTGTADHRDAQIRHAITRLLHWAKQCGVAAIAIEDLDFTAETTREKHGRRKRFRRLISGMPTGKLRARLVSMAAETGLAIVATDPAYTSQWGAQHWQKPLATPHRKTTRHDSAAVAIGRRALGHPIRRRTPPPRAYQSDLHGHRSAQAPPDIRRREETRRPVTERAPRVPSPNRERTRATSRASNTVRDARSDQHWVQDPLLVT
ncbi:IS200/IS605 family accessory protein TnpB-related protein [Kitasatospora sp. NPDC056181]|uniref:IS200/IS605 family accessory protein TnpB-related protein n=1 Tax=Kitasatospora sp. NPDC056181 TaxID=3345737 RepID=UPI0035E156D0